MLQTYDERNADIVYWCNGVLRHRSEPGISPFDSLAQGGDAVWEGLRVYDGRIFGLEPHLARLRRSDSRRSRKPPTSSPRSPRRWSRTR